MTEHIVHSINVPNTIFLDTDTSHINLLGFFFFGGGEYACVCFWECEYE